MRLFRCGLFGFALSTLLFPTLIFADAAKDCEKKSGEEAIEACNDAVRRNPKDATSYNNRGVEYRNKNDLKRAIDDFSQAIRLRPDFVLALRNRAEAYLAGRNYEETLADYGQLIRVQPKHAAWFNNRGRVYLFKNEPDRAIADFDQAVKLDASLAAAFVNRGMTLLYQGKFDRAIEDEGQAIKLDPRDPLGHALRAYANYFAGKLPQALADFNQASELSPKFGYYALWLEIVGKRSNLPSRLASATSQVDMTKWPAPLIRLFLSQLTPESVLSAADDPDPVKKIFQLCEADFYNGEWALLQGSKSDAERWFKLAASGCTKDGGEGTFAEFELKALAAR